MSKKILLLFLAGLAILLLVVGVVVHKSSSSSSNTPTPPSSSCQPPCASGFTCVNKQCVQNQPLPQPSSSCNPPCSSGYTCVSNNCVKNQPPPPDNTPRGFTYNDSSKSETCATFATWENKCPSDKWYCSNFDCKAGDPECNCMYCCTSGDYVMTRYYDCSTETTPPPCPNVDMCGYDFYNLKEGSKWLVGLYNSTDYNEWGQHTYTTKALSSDYNTAKICPGASGYLIQDPKSDNGQRLCITDTVRSDGAIIRTVTEISPNFDTYDNQFVQFMSMNANMFMSFPNKNKEQLIIFCSGS